MIGIPNGINITYCYVPRVNVLTSQRVKTSSRGHGIRPFRSLMKRKFYSLGLLADDLRRWKTISVRLYAIQSKLYIDFDTRKRIIVLILPYVTISITDIPSISIFIAFYDIQETNAKENFNLIARQIQFFDLRFSNRRNVGRRLD